MTDAERIAALEGELELARALIAILLAALPPGALLFDAALNRAVAAALPPE
ncbi:hypothetical protein ACI2KH_06205 [Roseomonas mucosa]|uniref:hypothetical protein n=1 Tax=Roseomonas mucosa TaxID=207340 RepID=UPI00385120E5